VLLLSGSLEGASARPVAAWLAGSRSTSVAAGRPAPSPRGPCPAAATALRRLV
jgi:hypothetical protein